MSDQPEFLDEICGNCGFRYGSHNGTSYDSVMYKMHIPRDYCPGDEGRMNWDKGQGTCFKPTGTYKEKH